jgi:hypothetical protein
VRGDVLGIVTVLNIQGLVYLLAGAMVLTLLGSARAVRVRQEGAGV